MGPLLALGSALAYGIADFGGGLLARRAHFAVVALLGQAGGLLATLAAAPLWPDRSPTATDLAWGALSGVGTGLAMAFLFRGLGRGAMSVVVPVSAVSGVALPVLTGVALLGDRPSLPAWGGIAVTVPALWLVSRNGRGGGRGTGGAAPHDPAATTDALLAGVGIAVQYLALAQAAPEAGVWPVAAGRAAAVVVVAPLALAGRARRSWAPLTWPLAAGAAATGVTAAGALVLYSLAVQQQLAVVAIVLSSLYPAVPVLLGLTALHERVTVLQATGLTGAAAAITLLALG
ncbi:EamA family transporter [Streptomyces johnsoniae]|uniref:EamA family transporter n=1 Tax=Streptomyces johnsoniae TaxID=3075532 RepID=A0ABU2S363_9ACTN|nr:EamA family transporter [Streptomyces sp. DSM 41886]MDT0442520.1 EamA family transporter [Streptomyces sp. DSM 41886]